MKHNEYFLLKRVYLPKDNLFFDGLKQNKQN